MPVYRYTNKNPYIRTDTTQTHTHFRVVLPKKT